ncbi:hypothetical protein BCR32DRAFT_324012 [Anaeromyces robustus]|uniref:Carbohydrate binding module family 25 domain-containing protein n=1 Tax=Anaeromyces robustus TaxID=1754192 RepID=A0A1Y1XR15_9FUNG|nr:hypothetical protein BCR32DRAFT_324012 [Anaeromyces robustus]|eukprot:ORX88188.1 hypothetical protein BCR32DRAFT_324012 [Anaeromyces robustus]
MKSLNTLFFLCTFFLSQIFSTYASPISFENELEKRSYTPFELHTSAIYFLKPEGWGDDIYAYHYSNDASMNTSPYQNWPGTKMRKNEGGFYYDIFYNQYFMNGNRKVIFTDGKNQIPAAMQEGFNLVIDGVYNKNGIIGISYYKPESDSVFNSLRYNNLVKLYYKGKVGKGSKVIAHYKMDNGSWSDALLTPFDSQNRTGYYHLLLNIGHAKKFTVAFHNDQFVAPYDWDNGYGENYTFESYSNFIVSPEYKNVKSVSKRSFISFEATTSAIYFKKPENWGEDVYVYHYSNDASMNTYPYQEWPGTKMNKKNGIYFKIFYNQYFISGNRKVIFTDGKNQVPAVMQEGFNLVIDAVYNENGIIGISYDRPQSDSIVNHLRYGNIAKLYYKGKVGRGSNVIAHYQKDNGSWADALLTPFDSNGYTGYYTSVLDLGNANELKIAFHNKDFQKPYDWDNSNGQNYNFNKFSNFVITN